jgi:hypothetical protein
MLRRAVPLVFLQGPWLLTGCWTKVRRCVEDQGWETSTVDLFATERSTGHPQGYPQTVEGQVEHLQARLKSAFPPIVVAHSTSAVVAQKFLESFALKGYVAWHAMRLSALGGHGTGCRGGSVALPAQECDHRAADYWPTPAHVC